MINGKLTLAALSASALLSSSVAARAQYVYQDLRGQLMRFTGVFVTTGQVDVAGISVGAINSTVISEVPPLGMNTTSVTYSDPGFFTFNNTGPADDSSLSYAQSLGTISVGSQVINLPTLNYTGSYNRTTGALDLVGNAAGLSSPINTTISGYPVSITVGPSSITFIGSTVSPPLPSSAVIVSTQPATLNIALSGTANLGFPLGNQPITFPGLDIQYTTWTLTAVPGPCALAVYLPGLGMLGSLVMRRRNLTPRPPSLPARCASLGKGESNSDSPPSLCLSRLFRGAQRTK